jgi:hypothetical protein
MSVPLVRCLPRCGVALSALAGLFALAGCGQREQIRSYDVAKTSQKAGETATTGGEYRILGAMFPADEPKWFFKLTGPADALAAHQTEFDQFLKSVRFPDGAGKPPKYDLPAGWKSAGPRDVGGITITDTITFGPAERPLKMTVTPAMGGVKANVQRWAGQVGGTADPTKSTHEITTASGVKGVRVDVSGPKNPTMGGGPFMRGR